MATVLHLIVLGTAARSDRKSLTPTPNDITSATDLAATYNINLQVHLIDPNYQSATRERTQDPDAPLLSYMPGNVEVYVGRYESWLKDHIKTNTAPQEVDDIVFITAEPMSTYAIMDYVESWDGVAPEIKAEEKPAIPPLTEDNEKPGGKWYIPGPVTNYTELLRVWLPTRPRPYPFYDGAKLMGTHNILDLEAIRLYAIRAANILQHYIALGYNTAEGKSTYTTPPSWVLNTETLPIKGFIGYYGLIPPTTSTVVDRDPAIEMRESADYRRRLTMLMATTMANFAINNNLITATQAATTGGWYNIATWAAIQDAIAAWDLNPFTATPSPSLAPGGLKTALLKPPSFYMTPSLPL